MSKQENNNDNNENVNVNRKADVPGNNNTNKKMVVNTDKLVNNNPEPVQNQSKNNYDGLSNTDKLLNDAIMSLGYTAQYADNCALKYTAIIQDLKNIADNNKNVANSIVLDLKARGKLRLPEN